MPVSSADHDLLLGMLALHLDFLSREQLLAALKEWAADKGRPLAQVIRGRDLLTGDEWAVLEALAQKHLGRHGQDVKKSLASLPAFLALREVLGQVAGDDFLDTVTHGPDASAGDDPYKTWPSQSGDTAAVGTPTSAGRRFRVLRPHAEGGLGKVSVALDGELNREVALKEIKPQYSDHPESRVRFLLEAEITGGLEHPGVVPVYGLGKHADGRPFYAMRFIRGDSLKDAIDRFHQADVPGRDPGERGLALRQLLGRFVDVCEAMAYAHSRGVLHRDLKPSNVMLGKYGETLVVDWGLAKSLGQRQPSEEFTERTLRPTGADSTPTQMGKAVGTPAYMSPEQAAGRMDLLGPASDVYSLGATLYTLLTGKPPVEGLTLDAVLRRVQEGDFPAPRKVKPQVAPALEAVCLKAMALKPEDRYGTAKELAEEVEHWLAGEPVKAWPEPWSVRAGRWLKRHRMFIASSVAAVMAVMAVALAVSTVLLTAVLKKEAAARADVQVQRDEALREKKRADANFASAKKAVEDNITKITDHPKLQGDRFLDLRKELLSTAVPFYDEFVNQVSDDPKLRAERGQAYFKLANLRRILGEDKQALIAFMEATEIFAGLSKDFPQESQYLWKLGQSLDRRGSLLQSLGEIDKAETAYRKAIALFRKLTETTKSVSDDRGDLAWSYNSLGKLLLVQGKLQEAESAFREAIMLQRMLSKAHPARPNDRLLLAQSYYNLGNLLRDLVKLQEAEVAFREAIKLDRALVADYPAVADYHNNLANSLNSLANLLIDPGQRAGAEAAFREAIKLRQELADTNPGVPDYRSDLAQSHTKLGALLLAQGKRAEAEGAFREAIKLRQELAAAYPARADYRSALATNYNNLGNLLRDQGKSTEGEAAYRAALKLQQALAAAHPAVADYRSDLAQSHTKLGALLAGLGKRDEAVAEYREAARLFTALAKAYPDVPLYRQELARSLTAGAEQELIRFALSLARDGDHAKAAAAAEALVKGNTSNALYYGAACAFALSSAAAKDDAKLREKYAARAVELLGDLHAAGYFNGAKNAARLKKDADLDPLRQRDDFRKLLAQVEKAP